LARGYRPCKVCEPMALVGDTPDWINKILIRVQEDPTRRMTDGQVRRMGIDPLRLRRWFKKQHGITFQAYLRSLRLGKAFGNILHGEKVIDTAFLNGYESLSGFTSAYKKAI